MSKCKCEWNQYDKNVYKEGMSIDEYNKAFVDYYSKRRICEIVAIKFKVEKEIDENEFEKLFEKLFGEDVK